MDNQQFNLPITPVANEQSGDRNMPLFLGLFLLILAFFILLVSMSRIEDEKTKEVMGSLNTTFSNILSPFSGPVMINNEEGEFSEGQELQEQLKGVFASELAVGKVQIIKPGKQMQVQYPLAKIFIEGTADIKPSAIPLFDRVIVSLSSRPLGLRHDMEFLISGPKDEKGIMPVTETLEIKRLGAFARGMMGRGMPPDAISVGLTPAVSNDVTLLFYTRDENETKLSLIGSIPASVPVILPIGEPVSLPVIETVNEPDNEVGIGQ